MKNQSPKQIITEQTSGQKTSPFIFCPLIRKQYKKLLPSGHPLLQKLFRRQSGQLLELSVKGSARTETGLRIDCVYIDRIVMRHQMDGIIYPVFGQPCTEIGSRHAIDGIRQMSTVGDSCLSQQRNVQFRIQEWPVSLHHQQYPVIQFPVKLISFRISNRFIVHDRLGCIILRLRPVFYNRHIRRQRMFLPLGLQIQFTTPAACLPELSLKNRCKRGNIMPNRILRY